MPIAQRELLVVCKSASFYRSRVIPGILMLVLGGGFALFYGAMGQKLAAPLVYVVGAIVSTLCVFMGAHLTADAIAKEKREGTLGLLFLTPLKPWQIVGQKLVASAAAAVCTLAVGGPLVCFLIVAGGITFSEVAYLVLLVINTLFVSASAGLYASTLNTERKKAASTATWFVMFFWWVLPMLTNFMAHFGVPPAVIGFLNLFTFNGGIRGATVFGMRSIAPAWDRLLCLHLVGWGFLGLAAYTLPRRWQDAPPAAKPGWRARWKQWSYGSHEVRKNIRVKLLDRNPFLWLASRDRLRAVGLWVMTLLLLAGGFWSYRSGGKAPWLLAMFGIIASVMHKAAVCTAASAQLLNEQEQGTIEMLLSTPLTPQEIARGQYSAIVRQFRGPVLLVTCFQLFVIGMFVNVMPTGLLAAFGVACYVLMYFFDLHTAVWIGMWSAVTAREPKNAQGAALGRLFIVPAAVFFGGYIVVGGLNALFGSNSWPPIWMQAAIWFALGWANDMRCLVRIRKILPGEIRLFAFRRYMPERKGFFAALGRAAGTWSARIRGERLPTTRHASS